MKRETIAIDVDDVLAEHVQEFVRFSNDEYGTQLTVDDYTNHWGDLWGVEDDEINRRAHEFHTPERLLQYGVIEQSDFAIDALAKTHELYVATARPAFLMEPTLEWVESHFGRAFRDVYFVPVWLTDSPVTKAEICREIGADYLIDDMPKHCNLAAEAEIRALLFGDYTWNRTEPIHPNVTRTVNWAAALDYFDGRD